LLLAACGDPEPSALTVEQIGGELAKGPDAFAAYVKALPNRLVQWKGTVVELRRWHEDDYVEAAGVLLDLDGKAGADAFMVISVGDADRLQAVGTPVTFLAGLVGTRKEKGRPILDLEARTVK